MSHVCHICELPFTRGYNLRRHIERVHKKGQEDHKINDEDSMMGIVKQPRDSSYKRSYDDISDSDTNDSKSESLEEDSMTESSKSDDGDADSDTEGADSSEEEPGADDTITDNDHDADDGPGNVCCPIDTLEALAQMNKAMGIILNRELSKKSTNFRS